VQNRIDQKKAEAKSTIDDWQANREARKLAHRADRAEEYAAATIRVALAGLDEAEQAVLEAVGARLDAEEAEKTPVH
jgi:tellurite resistance protein